MSTANDDSTAVVENRNAPAVFSDLDLARLTDFNSVADLFKEYDVIPEDMSDYGTGFAILKNKDTLVEVPFFILEWRFNESEFSDVDFVSAMVMTKNGDKFVLNDGSTGIATQLATVTAIRKDNGHSHPQAGLMVKNGLRKSVYQYVDNDGKPRPATTYYLSE